MINRILLYVLILLGLPVNAHKLTLTNLISLSKKQNWEDVNDYLIDKGWEYTGSSKGDYDKCKTISWAYDKDQYDEYAKSWFKLFDCDNSVFNLSYQVGSKDDYNLIFNALSSNGFKKTSSSILDDALITDYANSSYFLSVQTIKTEGMYGNSQTTYLFSLTSKTNVYDPNNGKQYSFYSSLKVKEEYNLSDGVLNGEYKSYYENGSPKIEGTYQNGSANGEFYFYTEKGVLYKRCNFKNDKLNGEFYEKYIDGTSISGTYLNGTKNGVFTDYDESGIIIREQGYKSDVENGIYKEYFKDGSPKIKGYVTNSLMTGTWEEFWPNGQLKSRKTFANDKLNGEFKEYDVTGKITFEGITKNGELNGNAKWFSNGNLSKEMNYLNGIPNGNYKILSYNGNTLVSEEIGSYLDGNLNGQVQSYRIKGTGHELYEFFTYTNGILNGQAQYLQGDSLVFANYFNDQLNGPILIYAGTEFNNNLNTLHSAKIDTVNLELILMGTCLNGKLNGQSRAFSKGVLIKEGSFVNGDMDGCWKFYYSPFYQDVANPFKGELFLEECYQKGNLNGKSIRYSNIYVTEKKEITSSQNTRFNIKKNQVYIEQNYLNNQLHGNYLEKDSGGLVVQEGNYRYGNKHGNWIERTRTENGHYNTFKGTYIDGKEEGEWLIYYNEDQIRDRVSFKSGNLDGKWIAYYDDDTETIRMELEFTDNKLKYGDVYNGGSSPVKSFEILDINDNEFSISITDFSGSNRVVTTYLAKENISKMNYHFFDAIINRSIEQGRTVKDGKYEESKSGKIIVQGNYLAGNRNGTWGFHYLDQNVTMVVEYKNGKVIKETYFEYNSNILYKGSFDYIDPNTGLMQKRKIKNGLRNGKTIYYGSSGEVLKKEIYFDGVLQ